jgi:uncharacterized protein YydD (DUF2326 family)
MTEQLYKQKLEELALKTYEFSDQISALDTSLENYIRAGGDYDYPEKETNLLKKIKNETVQKSRDFERLISEVERNNLYEHVQKMYGEMASKLDSEITTNYNELIELLIEDNSRYLKIKLKELEIEFGKRVAIINS